MLSIAEQIAENVFNTVSGVNTASGYNYDLTVQRHSRSGDKIEHLNAIIVQQNPKEISDQVYNTKEWWLPFGIGVFVIPPDTDTTPIDTYMNALRADVEQALMQDRYRGGLALDTQIRAPNKVVGEGLAWEAITIIVEINYRTVEINPYQQA